MAKLKGMQCCRWVRREWRRQAVAFATGLLLACAFPKMGITGAAWVAPGLLLMAGIGTRGMEAFRVGYAGGMGFFLGALYWLLLIPVPIAPIVGWVLLAAFLSLFSGGWVWFCWRLYPWRIREGEVAAAEGGTARAEGAEGVPGWMDRFLESSWAQRASWACACAAAWVTWEMIQARIFTGFPWNLLGCSQYEMLPLLQISKVTGVYGVSFLVCWFSVGLTMAMVALFRRPARRYGAALELALPAVAVFVVVWTGGRQILGATRGAGAERARQAAAGMTNSPPAERGMVQLTLIQPSIPQTTIWDADRAAERFVQLVDLTKAALSNNHPDIVVWPEAAVPSLFLWDTNHVYGGQTMYHAITGLARQHRVWMILGADDAEPKAPPATGADYFNSSFLVNPDGKVVATYHKQRLVIFGEYVPLSRWLPFLKDFTQVYGEFTPGKGPVVFELPELGIKTAVLICFEDVFPHHARKHVVPGLDFVVNITNNGWFGESAAQWQHAANAVFRAIENGLPLVRAANNGLTCWVDEHGRLHEVYFPGTKDIYQAGYKNVQVPILGDRVRKETFYHRYGDVFGWSCTVLTAAGLLASWRRVLAHGHWGKTRRLGLGA